MKGQTEPCISVIIPIYNAERFLNDCLDSVLSQTLADFEIICVDNSSTDGTNEILNGYSRKDARVKIIRNKKTIGAGNGRNVGLSAASGKYIYFLDADDELAPEALKTIYDEMQRQDVEVLCFGSREYGDLEEVKWDGVERFLKRCRYEPADGLSIYLQLSRNCEYSCPVWLYSFRKDFLIQNGLSFIENSICEDVAFTFDVHMRAIKMGVLTATLHHYRLHYGSVMRSDNRMIRIKSLEKIIIHFMKCCVLENREKDVLWRVIEMELSAAKRVMINLFEKCTFDERRDLIEQGMITGKDAICKEIYINECPYRIADDFWMSSEPIYLYGAGKVARRLIGQLYRFGKSVNGVIVSDYAEKNQMLFGWKAESVKTIANVENGVILVAVSSKYCEEAVEEIKNSTCLRYYTVSRYDEWMASAD